MPTATTTPARPARAPQCPACHSRAVARSRRRAILEQFVSLFGCLPYRCRDCMHRFFTF